MIIDGTDLILGRLASVVAKNALLGEDVVIINAEKAVVSGKRQSILKHAKARKDLGAMLRGPYISKLPDRYVRRAIRGMLPYKTPRGKAALKRVMCHIGVPSEMKEKKADTISKAKVSKLPNFKYVTVREICNSMGAGIE